jgi:hypothetical protein
VDAGATQVDGEQDPPDETAVVSRRGGHQLDHRVAEGLRAQVLGERDERVDERVVGVHRPLRLARGARGEAEVAQVGGRGRVEGIRGDVEELRPRVLAGTQRAGPVAEHHEVLQRRDLLPQPAGEREVLAAPPVRGHDEDLGPRAVEDRRRLALAVGHRHAGVDGPDLGDAEDERAVLHPVGQHQRDDVAPADPERRERGRHLVRGPVELPVGEADRRAVAAVPDQRDAPGVGGGRVGEQRAHRPVRPPTGRAEPRGVVLGDRCVLAT